MLKIDQLHVSYGRYKQSFAMNGKGQNNDKAHTNQARKKSAANVRLRHKASKSLSHEEEQNGIVNEYSSLLGIIDHDSNLGVGIGQMRDYSHDQPFDQEPHDEQECLICLETDFEQGRYILDCKHSFCNGCYKYWEQSKSSKCPVCNKRSTSMLSIFKNSSRSKNINPVAFLPPCAKCLQNNHYNLMYFCDSCNSNCIHIFCDSNLRQRHKEESWICKACADQDSHENQQLRQFSNQPRSRRPS